MSSPSLTPTYLIAVVSTIVGLFVTQNVIDNGVGQLVTGLAAVLIPLGFAIALTVLKGHQTQATSRLEAARVHASAVQRPVVK